MIDNRVKSLRELMKNHKMDYYIIPSVDPHQSEYVADRFKSREWISGFTGSAGTVIITIDKAYLWADGRYYIQAANEIEGTEFELMKLRMPNVLPPIEWIKANVKENETIGFDGDVIPYSDYINMDECFKGKNVKLAYEYDLVNDIWNDRPLIPENTAFILDTKYAGKSRTDKIKEIRREMQDLGADSYIVPNLDDICWTLNIRGGDIKYSPVVLSYLVITLEKVSLFVDKNKFTDDDLKELKDDCIDIYNYEDTKKYLNNLDEKNVLYSDLYTSTSLIKSLGEGKKIIDKGDIATRFKAVKNDTEIKNLIDCQIADGAAMLRFTKWLDESIGKIEISEVDIALKLKELRQEHHLSKGESFATISAYDANAAMMHYHATEDKQSKLQSKGFLLVDSGGQYLNGTTDITRTYALGELEGDRKRDYTLTLKSHIGLAKAIFLRGTTGTQLDILAR